MYFQTAATLLHSGTMAAMIINDEETPWYFFIN